MKFGEISLQDVKHHNVLCRVRVDLVARIGFARLLDSGFGHGGAIEFVGMACIMFEFDRCLAKVETHVHGRKVTCRDRSGAG